MNQKTILRSVLAAVLSLVATTATAHDFEVNGIYYNNNGDGTVSVTFKGSSHLEYISEYTSVVMIPSFVTYSETEYQVTSIGEQAFNCCSGLTSVSIPNSVTSIGYSAFSGCSGLTSVTIPNSVTSIGMYAFSDCSGLTSVTIPKSVTSIETAAFDGCSGLTSVTIPKSVTSIGDNIFRRCTSLNTIEVASDNPKYDSRNYCNAIIETQSKTLISGCRNTVIPNAVTSIGDSAFAGCSGLTSVTIPNSVTSIGYSAFSGCSGLASVTIPNSVTSIGMYAFSDCSGLTSVTIPNSVTSIGGSAFSGCSGLTSVTIGNSVTSIGYSAFNGCSGLTSVTIPNSVTSIDGSAFFNCSGLTSVTIGNSVTSIGRYAFDGCGLTRVDISSLEAWLRIKFNDQYSNPLYYAHHLYLNGEEVKNLVIPNSVTSIGSYSFYDCSGLTSVTIPNSVTSIGSSAFRECRGLTSVTIPNSVTSIGNSAFDGCSGLTSVTIPNSVTSIGKFVFFNCSGLTSVISKAVTPPTCVGKVFSTATYSVPLIVPSVAIEAYKSAPIWSNFSNYAEPERKITAMEFGASTFGVGNGKTLQLTAKVTPEDATFADVLQWESSNPEVATVDNEGLVTTLALGSTVITATSCDYSNISATCTVVVCQKAANVNDLVSGSNIVGFALQGVKMHNGVLYACTTTESVNKSTPTFHGNDANNMAPYEDRNFAEFDQRDWVAIRGLEGDFEGKELSYPFVATFADGVLTPSGTISATADATAYNLNTFRAENILHGGYNNYAEGDYTAYYVPARVNEVAKFMGLIETIGGVKYLYSNNAYGRTDGEGIKVEGTIADNSEVYSILEGILVADKSTKAGVKIIMLDYLGQATGVEGVDVATARIYAANGSIIISAAEDGEAAVYDFTGRLIKSVPVASGDSTAVPVMPGCYIVRTGVKTQSVVVK